MDCSVSRRCDFFECEHVPRFDLVLLEKLADPLSAAEHSAWFPGSRFGADVGLDGGVQPVKANLDGLAVPVGGLARSAETVGREEAVLTSDVDGVVTQIARRDADESLSVCNRSTQGSSPPCLQIAAQPTVTGINLFSTGATQRCRSIKGRPGMFFDADGEFP